MLRTFTLVSLPYNQFPSHISFKPQLDLLPVGMVRRNICRCEERVGMPGPQPAETEVKPFETSERDLVCRGRMCCRGVSAVHTYTRVLSSKKSLLRTDHSSTSISSLDYQTCDRTVQNMCGLLSPKRHRLPALNEEITL